MPDASPTRWHLAHTTWFFETFVLARWEANYRPFNEAFQILFNSYYNTVGDPFPRARRGLLTRPTVAEVYDYRHDVDRRIARLLQNASPTNASEIQRIVELGVHHEQQHQELLLTDIKHAFSCNPLWPTYRPRRDQPPAANVTSIEWIANDGGVVEIGHRGDSFAFDNESPRHKVYLEPFELSSQLVTVGEFVEFMNDGGYRRPELWLSLGWATVCERQWTAPLYWTQHHGAWHQFTLDGLRPIDAFEPACHVSYFEAEALARWKGARLPTEAEWEHAASRLPVEGSFVDGEHYHPRARASDGSSSAQMFGEVWQWTSSPYTPYPGFRAPGGALGEYNGKFMCNQYVLRGGSCATPRDHLRVTYRNFFPPDARWQFTGIRLARDAHTAGVRS
jgi:ergothioneine biosynthesis protein EgtB